MTAANELTRRAAGLTVGGLFAAQAALHPERIALQHSERRWSYGALDERVNRLARWLAAQGIARGDRIAILSENRPEYLELGLAAAKLGTVLACQNWRQADAELTHCVNLVAPKLLFVSERFADRLGPIDHDVPAVIGLGEEYERALSRSDHTTLPDLAEPEDGFLILYTSGTTGMPKGALISQRAMIARDIVNRFDLPAGMDDAFIAWAPLFHMGSTDMSFATLMRGGKVIVMDGFDAPALVATLARERVGWLQVMPGTAERIVAELERGGPRPLGVKSMGAMADLQPRDLLAKITTLLDAPFVNTFGATETGSPPLSKGLVPVGARPERLSKLLSSCCRLRLVDTEDHDVADGEPGEAALRAPTLFSGYWGAPEATAEDFRGGWFHMGDVFVRNQDGSYDFVDRRKYLIKSGGENIYPAEIERVLLAMPQIAEAAVVRKSDSKWGEVPVAFVVARNPALTADDIVAACRGKIANYKLPKEVRFVAEADLPRNVTGKIVRHELERLLK